MNLMPHPALSVKVSDLNPWSLSATDALCYRTDFFPVVSAKAHILARKITDVGPDKALDMQV